MEKIYENVQGTSSIKFCKACANSRKQKEVMIYSIAKEMKSNPKNFCEAGSKRCQSTIFALATDCLDGNSLIVTEKSYKEEENKWLHKLTNNLFL